MPQVSDAKAAALIVVTSILNRPKCDRRGRRTTDAIMRRVCGSHRPRRSARRALLGRPRLGRARGARGHRSGVSLTVAINGYDDGASTGEVRRFLGERLGPSDFRKNASRLARRSTQLRSGAGGSARRAPAGTATIEDVAG